MVTALLVALAMLVIAGTALAVVGKWTPEGLPAQPPEDELAAASGRLEVVFRGYRMDQVDALLADKDRQIATLQRSAKPTTDQASATQDDDAQHA